MRKRLEEKGYIVRGQTGAAFATSSAEQTVRWTRIVKATGFTAE